MIALALALAALAADGRTLEVSFLPDDALAPALVVAVENTGTRRALVWALVPPAGGSTSHSGSLTDQGGARGLITLPNAPRGSGLVERDGTLSITVDDAGAWEDAWQALVPSKAAALPVAGPRAFRLVVHGSVDGGPTSAVLYGTKVRITGTAIARTDRSELRAIVTTGTPKAPLFLEAPATAVDRVAGCGGEVPSAASVVTTSLALKLFAKGTPVCAGDLAVVPVEGAKLEAKKDLAVRGVLVQRR